ncbi:MAG: hypothetical protein C0481_02525 [Phenylobacterium sp.]|uniref:hypothetical protein n=1 Tax=Phenylobacterium sp. TaxID=1871053 RepID=UPI0025FC4B99|nr:hypothetical protein [Phenylobacterium sp.]MBA4010719.1 hypothetical protein [Phenylobacterium sp.]
MAHEATFGTDCIFSCGNAVDPSVYGQFETPHVSNFLVFYPSVMLISGPALKAADRWMMDAEGEDYLLDTTFNRDRKSNRWRVKYSGR